MSTENLKNFLEQANTDEALGRGLVQAVGDREGLAASQAVSEYAQGQGFDVTVEDADSLRQAANDGALNDEDLENVSGGVGTGVLLAGQLIGGVISGVISAEIDRNGGIGGVANNVKNGVVSAYGEVASWVSKW